MKKKLFTFLMTLILLTGSGTWAQAQTKGTHTFRLGDNQFWLDDKPFQIISGEIHPSRIPAEYWKQRIQMIKAMGCNTVACYIMWNYHESEPGVFDFQTGNKNLEKFIQTVQDEGMFLLFRPGPYVCGEWDFGGLPPYLLSIPDIKIRCMDTRYTAAVERYVDKIAPIIKKYEITNGGPIIMVQVENEYGSYGNDRIYMKWMHDLWRDKGIEVPFYTADGATPYMLEAGTLPGVAIGLDPAASKAEFDEALKVYPDASVFCSELYPGWLTHWREEWQHPSIEKITTDVKWLLDNGKSFNYYVIHGGTNFGFWAGANSPQPGTYQPDVTSYDYDAPINEMGQATPKYMALRELTQKYSKKKLAPIPDPIPTITFPATETKRYTSIWDNLPAAKQIVQPVPMEMMKQYEGMILYRTKLIGHKSGKLRVDEVHDYATVFLNGRYIGSIDRTLGQHTIDLPVSNVENPVLDILVESMGRINFAAQMIDRKGITDRVTLNGMTLMNWEAFNIPMSSEYVSNLKESDTVRPGMFFKTTLQLDKAGDCYIDLKDFTKGLVYVNGHNLGRFWNVGPQYRLYCPGVWLKEGTNEIIIFDMHQTEPGVIQGVETLE
jgi:beta-galactosidase